MNYEHLASTFGLGIAYAYRVDGERIVTNGHIAFRAPDDFRPEAKEYANLGELWGKHAGTPPCPLPVGGCRGEGKSITREVGTEMMQERYFRSFGDGVTWTMAAQKGDRALLAHRNGDFVGVVMPMKNAASGKVWHTAPTDREVFGPYASEENGWYLIDIATIDERIEDTEQQYAEAKIRLTEAKDEETEAKQALKSLRAARAAMEPVKA